MRRVSTCGGVPDGNDAHPVYSSWTGIGDVELELHDGIGIHIHTWNVMLPQQGLFVVERCTSIVVARIAAVFLMK
jgi:hypothetical protein